jgi:hypothetical protein
MKTIGDKCGWLIPRKERRVLRLLRTHTREGEREFVTNSSRIPRPKASSEIRIQVMFAAEDLTAFEPEVRFLAN